MNKDEFRDYVTHLEWSDALTWRSVRDLRPAQTDERLRYLLYHMHIVQLVYLQVWRGDPVHATELALYPDLPSLREWSRPYYAIVREFGESVDDSRFDRPIEFPWAEEIKKRFGSVATATLGDSAWQVFSHTIYHRAQVATRVRDIGGEPPLTDFIAWVWQGKPHADWD